MTELTLFRPYPPCDCSREEVNEALQFLISYFPKIFSLVNVLKNVLIFLTFRASCSYKSCSYIKKRVYIYIEIQFIKLNTWIMARSQNRQIVSGSTSVRHLLPPPVLDFSTIWHIFWTAPHTKPVKSKEEMTDTDGDRIPGHDRVFPTHRSWRFY